MSATVETVWLTPELPPMISSHRLTLGSGHRSGLTDTGVLAKRLRRSTRQCEAEVRVVEQPGRRDGVIAGFTINAVRRPVEC
jgi:hypothetical protein